MAKKFLSGIDLNGQLATSIGANVSTERLLGRSSAGTGAIEEISIGSGLSLSAGTLSSTAGGAPGGSTTQIQYNNAGSFGGLSTLTTDGTDITLSGRFISSLNGAVSAPPGSFTGTWFTGGDATTTKPQVLIEPSGTTSTAWSTNGTGLGVNAASGFTGNLLDLQVDGTTRFSVDSTSSIAYVETIRRSRAAPSGSVNVGGVALSPFLCGLQGTAEFGIASGGNPTTPDTKLGRDAAGIFAQRNDTNAQTFRCYGTFTDASNYVRAALSSTSTDVTLAAETAGTGADDVPLNLTAAGAGTVKMNSVAEVVASSTVANLPATPAVGMLTRVTDATTPTVGSTVVGGGSTAALVWYNGSNWVVVGGVGGSGVTDGDKGDITVSSSGASWIIDNDAVTFAKIQNITSARLLGRSTAGSGDAEEISIGTGLSLSAGTLSATGGGGSVGVDPVIAGMIF